MKLSPLSFETYLKVARLAGGVLGFLFYFSSPQNQLEK
jgi:hypothetical protein